MKRSDMQFIHDLLAKLDSRLDDIHEVQIKQQASLEEHIRRTSLLEEQMEPVRKHVYMVQGVGAFIGLLALVATILAVFK
jgi:hypothetical protein